MSLISHKHLRKYLLVGIIMWSTVSMTFYGLIFLIPVGMGNKYTKGMILAISEMLSCIFSAYSLNKFGRRNSAVMMFTVAGFCCLYILLY